MGRGIVGFAGLLLFLLQPAGAQQAPPQHPWDIPIAAFASAPQFEDIDLSPDGRRIAYRAPLKGRMHLFVRNLPVNNAEQPSVLAPSNAEIGGFDWVNNDRLLLRMEFTERVLIDTHLGEMRKPLRFSRLIAIDHDMSNQVALLQRPPLTSIYYMKATPVLQFIDDRHILALYPASRSIYPDIVKVDVYTGKREHVQAVTPGIQQYLPDPTGQARVAIDYDEATDNFTYLRRTAEGKYEVIKPPGSEERGFELLGFSSDGQTLYAASSHESDRMAVYEFDLETGTFGKRLSENGPYDVDGAMMSRGVMRGFTWTDDMDAVRWLDPALQRLQDVLDKAVPGSREIIIDRAADGRLTLVASLATDAPTIYRLFDKTTNRFDMIGDTYPFIPQALVAPRRPVTIPMRDGTSISGYLTLPVGGLPDRNLPFVVMPHGGPFARDAGSFDVLSQFLASRGYGVIQPNFRGSTGYGRAFQEAGDKQWNGLMQDDIADSATWVAAQGYADPQRMCILGWSFGGYSALMSAVRTPELFKCAVATAPVSNFVRVYDQVKRGLSYSLYQGTDPKADEATLIAMSPARQAEKIKIPVLLIHGELDVQVPVFHSRDMNKALQKAGKSVETILIEDMDHSPNSTEQLTTILSVWERFLQTHIGTAH